jgi:hypothetical protein
MKTMTLISGDWVFRWSGGNFIAVWHADRAHEQVPDDMIQLPPALNRSHAGPRDIERIIADYENR